MGYIHFINVFTADIFSMDICSIFVMYNLNLWIYISLIVLIYTVKLTHLLLKKMPQKGITFLQRSGK